MNVFLLSCNFHKSIEGLSQYPLDLLDLSNASLLGTTRTKSLHYGSSLFQGDLLIQDLMGLHVLEGMVFLILVYPVYIDLGI